MKTSSSEYDRFPDKYLDEIDDDLTDNYFTPVIDEILDKIPQPSRVCDVGCGNGVFSISIKNRTNCTLLGVDGSKHAIVQAKQIGFDDVYEIGDFCSETLPFNDNYFDLVFCKDVLEHLLDPRFLVAEIARITRQNGYCVIHVPNHFPLIGRIRFLLSNNIDTFDYFPQSNRWDFPHIRFFDKKSFIDLAMRQNLHPELDLSWHFFRPARFAKYIPRLAHFLGNHYSDQTSEGITMLFRKML